MLFLVKKWFLETRKEINTVKDRALCLNAMTGIPKDRLKKLLMGHLPRISHEDTDLLITRMGMPEQWYGVLSPWYYPPGSEDRPEYFPFLCDFLTGTDVEQLEQSLGRRGKL